MSGPATADDVQANASGGVLVSLSRRLGIVKPDGIAREAVTKPASECLLCTSADRLNPPSFRVDRIVAEPPFTVACSSRRRDRRDSKIRNLITMLRLPAQNSDFAQRMTATAGVAGELTPVFVSRGR